MSNWVSEVGTGTTLWAGWSRAQNQVGVRFFSSPKCPQKLPDPPNLLLIGYWVLYHR